MSLGSGGDLSILTDGASIFFGADSEIELRHVADDGLILKHVGTGDRYIHIVNAGTGNGDTEPSQAAKIKVLVEYVGMD